MEIRKEDQEFLIFKEDSANTECDCNIVNTEETIWTGKN